MWKKISHEEFIKRFMDKETSKYFDVIWEYIHSRKPIKVRCKTCWKEYMYSVAKELLWTTRKWCPDCRRKHINKHILNIDSINDWLINSWFLCVEYDNAKTPMICICKKCWRKFKRYKNNVIKKQGYECCRLCNWASRWEKIMAYILDNLWITYRFNTTLYNNNKLRYDFILDKEKIIIEIDWEFHYKDLYNRSSFTWRTFNDIKNKDLLKDKVALNAWYNIIRIKYTPRNDKLKDFFLEIYNKLWLFLPIEKLNFSIFDLFIL